MKPEMFDMGEEIRQAEDHLKKAAEIALEHGYFVFVQELMTIRIKTGKALLKIAQEVDGQNGKADETGSGRSESDR